MHPELVSLMKNNYFPLVLDEATDIAVCEQVAISAGIGDIDKGEVQSMLLGVEEVT